MNLNREKSEFEHVICRAETHPSESKNPLTKAATQRGQCSTQGLNLPHLFLRNSYRSTLRASMAKNPLGLSNHGLCRLVLRTAERQRSNSMTNSKSTAESLMRLLYPLRFSEPSPSSTPITYASSGTGSGVKLLALPRGLWFPLSQSESWPLEGLIPNSASTA